MRYNSELCIAKSNNESSAIFYDKITNTLFYGSTLLELMERFLMLIMQPWIMKDCWKGKDRISRSPHLNVDIIL